MFKLGKITIRTIYNNEKFILISDVDDIKIFKNEDEDKIILVNETNDVIAEISTDYGKSGNPMMVTT